MESNGLKLDFAVHEDRLSRVEVKTGELVAQVSAQGVKIEALGTQMTTGHDHIVEKLDTMTEHLGEKLSVLNKGVDVAQKTKERLDRLETERKVQSNMRKFVVGAFLALFSGAGALLVERLINH
jgi:ABC-type hemin transport system substrate-binding protein